jgi:hypothetical protein
MPGKPIATLEVRTRREWRNWLQQDHHGSVAEIWLVSPKRHTGQGTMSYDDVVDADPLRDGGHCRSLRQGLPAARGDTGRPGT